MTRLSYMLLFSPSFALYHSAVDNVATNLFLENWYLNYSSNEIVLRSPEHNSSQVNVSWSQLSPKGGKVKSLKSTQTYSVASTPTCSKLIY